MAYNQVGMVISSSLIACVSRGTLLPKTVIVDIKLICQKLVSMKRAAAVRYKSYKWRLRLFLRFSVVTYLIRHFFSITIRFSFVSY